MVITLLVMATVIVLGGISLRRVSSESRLINRHQESIQALEYAQKGVNLVYAELANNAWQWYTHNADGTRVTPAPNICEFTQGLVSINPETGCYTDNNGNFEVIVYSDEGASVILAKGNTGQSQRVIEQRLSRQDLDDYFFFFPEDHIFTGATYNCGDVSGNAIGAGIHVKGDILLYNSIFTNMPGLETEGAFYFYSRKYPVPANSDCLEWDETQKKFVYDYLNLDNRAPLPRSTSAADGYAYIIAQYWNSPDAYFELEQLFSALLGLLEKIDSGQGTVARLFNDPKLYDNFNELLVSSNAVIDSIEHGSGTTSKLITDPGLYEDATRLVERLTMLTEKLESGQGSLGQMVNDRQLYDRFNAVTVRLDSLIKDIKLHPNKYLKIEIF